MRLTAGMECPVTAHGRVFVPLEGTVKTNAGRLQGEPFYE